MKRVHALAFLVPLAIACGSTNEPKETESDIIGGAQASGRRLDAIGSLGRPLRPSTPPVVVPTEDAGANGEGEDAGASDAGPATGEDAGGGTEGDAGVSDAGGDDAEDGGTAGAEGPEEYRVFCTATLVAPKLVLTAKHCVKGKAPSEIWFNIGPDGTRPTRAVPVVNVRLAALGEGGFVKLGADVTVLELAEEVNDVAPLRVLAEPLSDRAVGSRFSAVGFGIRDRQRTLGKRIAGTLTLRATQGAFAQKIFGSFEDLVAFAKAESPEGFGRNDENRLRTDFWDWNLLSENEAFLGLADGDAQPCSGDSGGPLVARMGGELVVAGVVSGSFKLSNTYANPCSVLGEVYATFGPDAQAMFDDVQAVPGMELRRVPLDAIDEGSPAILPDLPAPAPTDDADGGESAPSDTDGGAPTAVDRCRGLSDRGVCEKDAVLRCVAPDEGPPRATRIDCTLLLSTCQIGSDGTAGCADL